MKLFALPLIICLFCLAVHTSAQVEGFSESKAYRPSEGVKEKKKDKAKNATNRTAVLDPASGADSERVLTLPVSVFDRKGQFYKGLAASDFTLFIDEKEVPISKFGERAEPATVVLVIDTSPSAFFEIDRVRAIAKEILSDLPPEVNVATVEFNISMNLICDVTADREKARSSIDKVKLGNGTSVYSAVEVLFREIDPKLPGRKVAILLTDGVDTTSRSSSYAESLLQAEKSSMSVHSIYIDTESGSASRNKGNLRLPPGIIFQGVGPMVRGRLSQEAEYERGRRYLNDLAELSGGRFIPQGKFVLLGATLGEELKLQYYITFSLPPSTGKRSSVTVRVNKAKLTVLTRGSVW